MSYDDYFTSNGGGFTLSWPSGIVSESSDCTSETMLAKLSTLTNLEKYYVFDFAKRLSRHVDVKDVWPILMLALRVPANDARGRGVTHKRGYDDVKFRSREETFLVFCTVMGDIIAGNTRVRDDFIRMLRDV